MPDSARQHATFHFYGELNDFLPRSRRDLPISHQFDLPASVKDIVESIGVPHTEVDRIVINDTSTGFERLIHHGDEISVYPASCASQMQESQLRPPLSQHRFILDAHLGRLARYLRILGFDALYRSDCEDKDLARLSHDEHRILLTRDRGLLKRGEVVYGYFVRATEARQQAIEVLRRYNLFAACLPFRRCPRCNALLETIAKENVFDRLQPNTRQHYDSFRICPSCSRIYWEGSHYERLRQFVQETLAQRHTSQETRDHPPKRRW